MNKFRLSCLLAFASCAVFAQGQDEFRRPVLNVGDSWTYQRTDLWKNVVQLGTMTIAVKKVKDEKIQFRGTNLEGNKWSYDADLDQNIAYTFKGDKFINHEYVWPLKPGKTWKNDREYASGEAEVTLEETCDVGSLEKVTVPAGEFDTYKISCKSFFTNTLGGQGSLENLRWYAPSVKRYVKVQRRGWCGSRLDSQSKDELTAFHLAQPAEPAK